MTTHSSNLPSDQTTPDLTTPCPPLAFSTLRQAAKESGVAVSSYDAQSFGLSDVGHKRSRNEDCFDFDDEQQVYVVADGIGSRHFGHIASRIAVDGVVKGMTRTGEEQDPLSAAVHHAHGLMRHAIRQEVALRSMATTVVALLLEGHRARIAHVGDSRVYRLRGNHLKCLTRDHSLATELVDSGELSQEEADRMSLGHVLTRALSWRRDLEVESSMVSVQEGDLFLLCSDGLTNMVSDDEILVCMQCGGGPEAINRRLIEQALYHGGNDNVTAIVVEIREPSATPRASTDSDR